MNKAISFFLFSLIFVSIISCTTTEEKKKPLLQRRYQSPDDIITAAKDLFKRVLPQGFDTEFQIEVIPVNPKTLMDVFEIENIQSSSNNKTVSPSIIIRGNSAASIGAGLGWYLKYFCNASYAWSGSQIFLTLPLPSVSPSPLRLESSVEFRYFLNVCTHSYTMAWWDWETWQYEIDWMALNGINMALAFTGQEYLWSKLFTESFGFTDAELDDWFTGPAFLAWGRMGNIRGYGGPLSKGWMSAQFQLQQQILTRLRELGIIAILPAFAGHVPPSFPSKYPNSTVSILPTWAGFNSTFSGDTVLDATDPLFSKISVAFLKLQSDAYNGTDHVYNADTFNEMVPSSNDPTFLANQSRAVYSSYSQYDPHAIWMIQGWMFTFDSDFWKLPQIEGYLSGVPNENMIILDLDAWQNPMWDKTNSFFGKPFIWCIIDDGGQRPGMYGDLNKIVSDITNVINESKSIYGVGLASEGLFINYINFVLVAEMGWRNNESIKNITNWLNNYSSYRYALTYERESVYDNIINGWKLLHKYIYSEPYEQSSSMFSERPALRMDSCIQWMNVTGVTDAFRLFHKSSFILKDIPSFRFDYIDLTRQVLSNLFEDVFTSFMKAYNTKSLSGVESIGIELINLISDIDRVLATHYLWTVGNWIEGAKYWATLSNDEDNSYLYESNARHLITIWGPNGELNGYATRHLSGLTEDYHNGRWKLFVSRIQESLKNDIPFDEQQYDSDCFYGIEKVWAESKSIYPSNEIGSTVEVIDKIFKKYVGNGTINDLSDLYDVYYDSTGTQVLYSNLTLQTYDIGHLNYLCQINDDCNGFTVNGLLQAKNSLPVSQKGSILLLKKQSKQDLSSNQMLHNRLNARVLIPQ